MTDRQNDKVKHFYRRFATNKIVNDRYISCKLNQNNLDGFLLYLAYNLVYCKKLKLILMFNSVLEDYLIF